MSHQRAGIWFVVLASCGGGAAAPDAALGAAADAGALVDASPLPPDAPAIDAARPDAALPDAAPDDAAPDAAIPDGGEPDAADPCLGVPAAGVCTAPNRIDHCVYPEAGDPYVETIFCGADEACSTVDGQAECVLTVACREGDTQCIGATQIRTCVNGAWVTKSCPRECIGTPLGDFCGLDESTRALTGTLRYELRLPNATRTDWGSQLYVAPAQGFLAISARLFPDGSVIPIDAAYTSEGAGGGAFSLKVASNPQAGDAVLFLAARPADSQTLALALAYPDLPPSPTPYLVTALGASPGLWFWEWPTTGLVSGQTLTITEAMSAGAARVFDYMRFVFDISAVRWPGHPRWRLLTWLGGGVSWTCGACTSQQLGNQFGTWFGSQMWLNGGPDAEWWADAVTAHELGHWAMASYGHIVGEGGPHGVSSLSTPGLAWSEGYATWFSADARRDPVYVDKQQGTMFWLDLSARTASNYLWPYPIAADGLYQNINENEVSAMLWSLSATQQLGAQPLDAALASARMTLAPFLRGYTTPYGLNTTFLGDFLDALRCGGVAAATIDAATQPATRFPYPSESPLCLAQAPGAPATLHLDRVAGEPSAGHRLALRARLERHGPWPYPISLSAQLPRGATRRPTGDPADIELDLATVPDDDLVVAADSQGPAGGFHAEARYRFGRPEPVPRAVRRAGPVLRLGPLVLGRAIRGDRP